MKDHLRNLSDRFWLWIPYPLLAHLPIGCDNTWPVCQTFQESGEQPNAEQDEVLSHIALKT